MNSVINQLGKYIRYLPDKFVFGGAYRAASKVMKEYQLCADKVDYIQEYQAIKLREILSFAEKTKYYRENCIPLNINIFEKIPLIDKAIMRQDISKFVFSKKNAVYGTTGGTSGKPFGFYIDKNRRGIEWFWMTNNWSRVGFDSEKSYRAVLRNHPLKKGEMYRDNSLMRELDFSNYNLTDEYIEKVIRVINQKNTDFIHAYPSAAFQIAKYLLKNDLSLTSVKAFLCGSENIYVEQRELFRKLNVRLFSWYGHSEKLILAGECEHSTNYHAIPFYGYAELIDENGKRVTKKGEVGELVGTGFINTRMPFVRYRTGDYAEYVGDQCSECGRYGLIFKNVKGRWSGERIYSSDGTYVTTTALNMHSDVYENINGMQYYQHLPGRLEVRVVPDDGFSDTDIAYIKKELSKKLTHDFEISIKIVDELEYTENRKFKLLIQDIQKP